jgi:hypothetical protein
VSVLGLVLLIVLILLLFGGIQQNWGPYPNGGIGIVLVILIVLLVLGRI